MTEHSLDELLDDTVTCQDAGKTRENDPFDTNGKIDQSIGKVCSILFSQRPSQLSPSMLEGTLVTVVSTDISSASCAHASAHDKRDGFVIDQFPQNKVRV